MDYNRPSPEEILNIIKASEPSLKGKLKIFFGACAGVGKTFSMLSSAQEKLKDNVKVMVGVVETHGRVETMKQLEGIPTLPLKPHIRQSATLYEFDLDGALKAAPEILLIDELAHSNLPGSRHPKRWQDVLELLDHGIDVYTTLNVQHLDSLNDIVAQITGIQVRETIPDLIFDEADEIVLVDIPSEIILERLKEGKVYLGEFTKKKAALNFFKIENLVALREMALHRMAERVEAEKDLYLDLQKQKKRGRINHILVCIGPGKNAAKLIRVAKQYAARSKTTWTALYVESKEHFYLSKEEITIIEKNIHQAQLLGASTMVIPSLDIAEAIINFANEKGIGTILIGKSRRYLSGSIFSHSMVKKILESELSLDVYVVNLQNVRPLFTRPHLPKFQSYAKALFVLVSVTAIAFTLRPVLALDNIIILYLMAIIYIAVSTETLVTVLSVFAALLIHNFVFVPPYYHINFFREFSYYGIQIVLTVMVFIFISLLLGVQTNKLRIQNQLIKKRAKYNAELYAFTQKLLTAKGKAQIVNVTTEHIGNLFNVIVLIWEADDLGHLQLLSYEDKLLDAKEESAAIWCYENNHEAGKESDTIPSARGYYWPLSIGEKAIGTVGIIAKDVSRELDQEEKSELLALITQATLAFERVRSSEEAKIFSSEYDYKY